MKNKFSFGKNWQQYSNRFLSQQKISEAEKSLKKTFGWANFLGKTFLDVGCGSGIFSIAAANLGSEKVIGFDIDPISVKTAELNKERFLENEKNKVEFKQASVLNPNIVNELGVFDIVYAWGSLHHTGDMYTALGIISKAVRKKGIFCVSIYNKDITSPAWLYIKRIYNKAPSLIKALMLYLFAFVIYIAKLIYTRKNPIKKDRGMSFFYDIVDWLGGYPYEFATKDEIVNYLKSKKFVFKKFIVPEVPTGCNTFIFERS